MEGVTDMPAKANVSGAHTNSLSGRTGRYALYLLWFIVIFSPQFWLASFGPDLVKRIPLVVYVFVGLSAAAMKTNRGWYPQLLVFVGVSLIMVPFAVNPGYALAASKKYALLYVLAVATIRLIRTPAQLLPVLLMWLLQYLWWAVQSGTSGYVPWHPILDNYDAFGPMMVMGIGYCFFIARSAISRRLRVLSYSLAAYSVLGLVASYARGAVLSAGVIAFIIWLRSAQKVKTALAGTIALLIVVGGTRVLFDEGEFWAEIASSFSEGTSEGTGKDRYELWRAATMVFMRYPIFGAGADNFGVAAATGTIRRGELELAYEDPTRLYGRHLHSIYFQILSEFGLVGSIAFILILVDFWRRNNSLRNHHILESWCRNHPTLPKLRELSIALETTMIGYLLCGFFYNLLIVHWFFSLVALNYVLHQVALTGNRETHSR